MGVSEKSSLDCNALLGQRELATGAEARNSGMHQEHTGPAEKSLLTLRITTANMKCWPQVPAKLTSPSSSLA